MSWSDILPRLMVSVNFIFRLHGLSITQKSLHFRPVNITASCSEWGWGEGGLLPRPLLRDQSGKDICASQRQDGVFFCNEDMVGQDSLWLANGQLSLPLWAKTYRPCVRLFPCSGCFIVPFQALIVRIVLRPISSAELGSKRKACVSVSG